MQLFLYLQWYGVGGGKIGEVLIDLLLGLAAVILRACLSVVFYD